MGFKYINPGIYPVENQYATHTTSSTYTQTGHAFSTNQTSESDKCYLTLINLDDYHEEIYGKFDIYVPAVSTSVYGKMVFGVTDDSYPQTLFTFASTYNSSKKTRSAYCQITSRLTASGGTKNISIATNISYNSRHSVYFHLVNDAVTKIYLDGTLKVDRVDETMSSTNPFQYCNSLQYNQIRVYVYNNIYISNIILSDSLISLSEAMIEVPISSTSTNMTEDSGAYSANAVGKYLLQTPDKNSLIASYPEHRVTGISTIAYPAYTDGTPSTIVSRESDLQRDSISLTSSNVAGALSSWKANLEMNQIDSKKYGWEVIS